MSMSTTQKPVCLNRSQLVVDAAADADADADVVVGTLEAISAAVESEVNKTTAEIKMNVSPSMAGARPIRSSGFAVVYMSAVIYEARRPRGLMSIGKVLWKRKAITAREELDGDFEAPCSPVTVPLAAVSGLVAH